MVRALFLHLFCAAALLPATSFRAFVSRGEQLMEEDRFDEAAAQFQHALELNHSSQSALRDLAICEFQMRDFSAAKNAFISLLPNPHEKDIADYYLGRIALSSGENSLAISYLQALAKRRESEPIQDEAFYLGIALYKDGQLLPAIDSFHHATDLNPRDARAHQWLARALQKAGRDPESKKEFDRSRELHQYYLDGSIAIGECRKLIGQQNLADAWQRCERLLHTDDVDKLVAIGMLFGGMGDYTHALEAWKRANALDPDSAEIQHDLAFTYYQLHDLTNAREHAANAVRLRPDFAEALVLYGTVLFLLREDHEAESVLVTAHEMRPDDENISQLLSKLRASPGSHP